MSRSKKKRKKTAVEQIPQFLSFEPRWSVWWPLVLALPWVAAIIWNYYRHLVLPFGNPSFWMRNIPPLWDMRAAALANHLTRVVPMIVLVAAAAALGRGLLRRVFRAEGLNTPETFAYGLGLGIGTVGMSAFALGAAGLLKTWAVYFLAAGLAGAAAWLNRDLAPGAAGQAPAARPPSGVRADLKALFPGPVCVGLAVLSAGALLYELFHALAPEISYDALVYHMGLPNLYRLEGGLAATPTNMYSGIPMLLQWVFTFLLFFGDEIFAKLAHWACGLGAAAAFLGLGLRCRRPMMGWAACAAFFCMPMVVYNIIKAAVDVGSSFFVLLSVSAAALYVSAPEPENAESPASDRLAALSGVMCGLAMGVKYTNWPLLPVLAAGLWHLKGRKGAGLFAGTAAAAAAPWALKNLVLYLNPVFPYLHELIAPGSEFPSNWRNLQTDAWARNWGNILSSGRSLWETLAHPWYQTVKGGTEFDHPGTVFLIGLTGLAYLRTASRESRLWLWTIFGLWLLWWPFTGMPRFFLPGLCLLSAVIGFWLTCVPARWARYLLAALLAVLCVDNLCLFSEITHAAKNVDYLVRGMSKEKYLSHTRKTYLACYYRGAKWLGENSPEDARVLLVGGGRGHYVPRRFVASSQLDVDVLAHWTKNSRDAAELWGRIREAGVTHMMINMAWIWRRDPDAGVTKEKLAVLEDFFRKHARIKFSDVHNTEPRWVLVYELGDKPGGEPEKLPGLIQWYRIGGITGLKESGQESISVTTR